MAKAKKLPSGKWRVLMYDQTGIDGKRKYKCDRFLIAIGIDPNQWVVDHRECEEL